jgi:hypothetical protein
MIILMIGACLDCMLLLSLDSLTSSEQRIFVRADSNTRESEALRTVRYWMDQMHLWINLSDMVPIFKWNFSSSDFSRMAQPYFRTIPYSIEQAM